jgi:hypothetical protein
MKWHQTGFALLLAAAVAAGGTGCSTRPFVPPAAAAPPRPAPGAVLRDLPRDPALDARILELDPERITDDAVRNTLAKGPAPRIVLLHGGIYPVYLAMVSFGHFLTGMGYPEDRIRSPGDRQWSHSPYESSENLAGMVAWHYENDGLRPMLVGHSQGGVQAVKILRELAGQYGAAIAVWNPVTGAAEDRVTIVDPYSGRERPVVGLKVSYASVVGAGGAALLLPNQWSMIGRLHTVPDTVDGFTGYSIGLDLIAWSVPGASDAGKFRHNGTANVRNVTLPATYNHVTIPVIHPLALDPAVRDWINAYDPRTEPSPPPLADEGYAVLWAADVWYDIKKHWCLEAQQLIRARAARVGPP